MIDLCVAGRNHTYTERDRERRRERDRDRETETERQRVRETEINRYPLLYNDMYIQNRVSRTASTADILHALCLYCVLSVKS